MTGDAIRTMFKHARQRKGEDDSKVKVGGTKSYKVAVTTPLRPRHVVGTLVRRSGISCGVVIFT